MSSFIISKDANADINIGDYHDMFKNINFEIARSTTANQDENCDFDKIVN